MWWRSGRDMYLTNQGLRVLSVEGGRQVYVHPSMQYNRLPAWLQETNRGCRVYSQSRQRGKAWIRLWRRLCGGTWLQPG